MKQSAFEARYESRWDEFRRWIDHNGKRRGKRRRTQIGAPQPGAEHALTVEETAASETSDTTNASDLFSANDFAARYRELCQHLALARDRQYSADLADRLNDLALAGHHVLYGARGGERHSLMEFCLAGFPRLVRAEWRYIGLATLLFFGPLIGLTFAVQWWPDLAYYFVSPSEIAGMRSMYEKGVDKMGPRNADTDVMMFAYYIWNNVKIGFQTFAGGMLFGLGSIFFLLFNGVVIGAVAGYLTSAGMGENFWSFVSGHSGMELTAIALSGGAGLRLAHGLIAPGRLSRQQSLVAASKPAIRVMIGAAAMFVVAAIIEGFWSPHRYLPVEGKYAVGIALWGFIVLYFAFAGRRGTARSMADEALRDGPR